MTTIAYKHPHIAYDSLGVRGGIKINCDVDKTGELDGYKFFFSGEIRFKNEFMSSYLNKNKTKVFGGLSAIIVHPDNSVYVANFDDDGFVISDDIGLHEYYAIGSGNEFAISAMDLGKSAIGAVKYAKKRDLYTGRKVKYYVVGGE